MVAIAAPGCPKCGAPRTDAAGCPGCGLSADRAAAFASQLDATVPEVARTAWDQARARWDDPAAHDELLRLTTLHGCYAWVAARYREARGGAGGEAADPIAERQLDRIRRAAEAALMTSGTARAARGKQPYQSSMLVLGLVVVLIVVGVVYAMVRRGPERAPAAGPGAPVKVMPPAPQVR